jgi:carboxynorspermidine decarboxylase
LNIQNLSIPTSPAFLLDKDKMVRSAEKLQQLQQQSGCKVLYSIKSLPLITVLQWLKPYVAGFSVSSLFEARLAAEVLSDAGSIHLTSPGINAKEIKELVRICHFISFNSVPQLSTLANFDSNDCNIGLRVNPGISSIDDARYDPCRTHSKLGAPLQCLHENLVQQKIRGLHIHTHFAGKDFSPLEKVVALLERDFQQQLHAIDWLNLGGGYLLDEIEDLGALVDLIRNLQQKYQIQVFLEPGNAVVGRAGFIVASVIDLFVSDGKKIAVLDTSVNHNPEVFEYQIKPPLLNHDENGCYCYDLVGNTCLSGDVFGEYRFSTALAIGDSVCFKNVGAYSLVKASRFNGHNLPDIYAISGNEVTCLKTYSYQDYRNQWVG